MRGPIVYRHRRRRRSRSWHSWGASRSRRACTSKPQQTWIDLFVVSNYLIGLGLSGLLLIALHYVTGARWSLPVRPVYEAMTADPASGCDWISRRACFSGRALYSWAVSPASVGSESPLRPCVVEPAVLSGCVRWFTSAFGWPLRRPSCGIPAARTHKNDPAPTTRNVRLSALFLVVFGVTVWLASYDWIMSLEPDWASTVFGVYSFSSLFLSGLAACILLVIWLRRNTYLKAVFTEDRLHDLGTLLFAFSSFWMYAWFCQYMLIWYVNIPRRDGLSSATPAGDLVGLFCCWTSRSTGPFRSWCSCSVRPNEILDPGNRCCSSSWPAAGSICA